MGILSSQLLEKIKSAGVVGAGGGGFPSWAKLQIGAEVIIVNGAECEPLLRVDQQLMARYPREIAEAVKQLMNAVGARKGVLALKRKYKPARMALQTVLQEYPDIDMHILDDIYPAGDEHLLVYSVTGKVIPPGQLPVSVGAIVFNTETVLNIFAAFTDTPVTHKFVTVTGAVDRPCTIKVPLGVSAAEMIKLAGGATVKEYVIISGGPCMGRMVEASEPVTKTTKGLVLLPVDHQLVRLYRQDIAISLKKAMALCCQCQQCTDLCPRYLLGHPIRPHRVMRAAAHNLPDAAAVSRAVLCSECGVCDLYACPAGLTPRAVNRAIKRELQQREAKITNNEVGAGLHMSRQWRQIPAKRLLMRLGLEQYDAEAPLVIEEVRVKEVRLALKQHAGVPAEPLVGVGDKVKAGQQVGFVPADSLGASLHASIDGTVVAISPVIIIRGQRGGAN